MGKVTFLRLITDLRYVNISCETPGQELNQITNAKQPEAININVSITRCLIAGKNNMADKKKQNIFSVDHVTFKSDGGMSREIWQGSDKLYTVYICKVFILTVN